MYACEYHRLIDRSVQVRAGDLKHEDDEGRDPAGYWLFEVIRYSLAESRAYLEGSTGNCERDVA